jgi:hypothetical protein
VPARDQLCILGSNLPWSTQGHVGVALDVARILHPADAAYPYSSPSSTTTSTILELCEGVLTRPSVSVY